ncbi:hypothetical protein Tco_0086215 [Tanacetum coccineum]
MTTQGIHNHNADIHTKEPSVFHYDQPVAPIKVHVENEPQKTKEQVVQPPIKLQTPSIPFPRRLTKEKEKAQQQKFLENLKQLHINFPFIEALAQMPKYTKFLKSLLTNKARIEEAYTDLEKSIYQSDLESFNSVGNESDDNSDTRMPIRCINSVNTPYSVTRKTTGTDEVNSEHLYLASANEIDEKKPKLKDLPHHLEYAYLHGSKSFPIIISSKFSKKEKMLLLHVLEKRKGAIA